MAEIASSRSLRVVYAGTPDFAVPALKALVGDGHQVVAVYTQPDRPAGRGRKLQASSVKRAALELDLGVEQPLNFKEPVACETLAAFNADVMVVAAYGLILPKTVLDLPTHGCINIHASLLPRWRGAAPIQRAILAGDEVSGASIMLMAEGLDTGPVISRVEVPIDTNMTTVDLHDRIAEDGARELLDVLPKWCGGEFSAHAQNDANATYAKKLNKQEARIDWYLSALEIHRKIMAFNPWPVAETAFDEERKLRIWRSALPASDAAPDLALAPPGSLQVAGDERLFVACADSWLELLDVQLPGRKAMPSRDFLKSNSVENRVLGAGQSIG